MVDFTKTQILDYCPTHFLFNPGLDFDGEFNLSSLEDVSKSYTAHFHCMKLEVFKGGAVILSGSLQKFYNSFCGIHAPNQFSDTQKEKGFNGDQFNFTKLSWTLYYLSFFLNVPLSKFRLVNIEFGVNLAHMYCSTSILQHIFLHKSIPFSRPMQNTYRAVEHSQYWVKVYDKALQYGLPSSMLRVETKFKKAAQFARFGLTTLEDLLDDKVLKLAGQDLQQKWQEIILYDYTIEPDELTEKEQRQILSFSNPNYWMDLHSNRMYRPKQAYQSIEQRHSQHVQLNIELMIAEVWQSLSQHCQTLDLLKTA